MGKKLVKLTRGMSNLIILVWLIKQQNTKIRLEMSNLDMKGYKTQKLLF
jgi:hypothetical protein